MTELELHLLNDFQHDFPLAAAPFRKIAAHLGSDENAVLAVLARLQKQGAVSRVGAVFRPHTIGASTLAAMATPEEKLLAVAHRISLFPEINHNYEREHHYNLWFVATAPDSERLGDVLRRIQAEAGYPLLVLPMLEDFHIDLGFDLAHSPNGTVDSIRGVRRGGTSPARYAPHPDESRLIAAIQNGIPLAPRPYAEIGAQTDMSEAEVIAGLSRLLEQGVIRRLGVVVRHHELGYRANAMVVWDVPDADVGKVGRCLGQFDCVTLCYRRPRRPPEWRYNLFSMIHGRDRNEVLGLVDQLRAACKLADTPHEVLFSRRRFKQCGARYVEERCVEAGVA
ncbi:MAG: Lrp/AsnC family transcriptional regulator [Sulfuricellaceae bacterium]